MKSYKYIFVLLAFASLTSCDDYLDVPPNKSTAVVPKTIENLEALLNDYDEFAEEPSNERVFGTDDYQLTTTIHDSLSSGFSAHNAQYATWDVEYTPLANRQYWPSEWEKIFTANLVLENLPEVTGGSDEQRANLRAEAHFIIAYSYFNLATVYCLPYSEQNKAEMGLPIKTSTSFEESVARVSLEGTYKFIAYNLEQALTITRPFYEVNGKNRSWRASTVAVNGFAARYYLSQHDYAKAEEYAGKALQEYNWLRNYNSGMDYSSIPTEVTIFNPDPVNVEIKYPYTVDADINPVSQMAWGETYYYRYLENESYNYYPSEELLELYDKNYDLRYKYHIVENYSYVQGAVDPPYKYPGYIFFYYDKIPSGPSVPEMILIKAEAQIRQGTWANGIETVNQLRIARMDAGAPANIIYLSASSQEEALTKVLAERRRELPFVHRWMDMRRYNNNTNPSDDVVVTRTFYPYNSSVVLENSLPKTYTLEKGSRLYARPIPVTEIISSQEVMKQNVY